jgi:serine/threonine-protein kinase SRPK3
MQAFELLTGHWLFQPQGGPAWSIEDDHLAKMMELTGEKFSKTMLARCRNREEYFDEDGWPHHLFFIVIASRLILL